MIGGPSPVTELSTELFRFWNSISSWVRRLENVVLSRPVQVKGKGDRGDPDFRSLLYGRRLISYQECVGEDREDGLDREAMPMPLLYR